MGREKGGKEKYFNCLSFIIPSCPFSFSFMASNYFHAPLEIVGMGGSDGSDGQWNRSGLGQKLCGEDRS